VNTVLGNVKSSLSGAYHAFGFDKYAERYLGAIAYRFNRRFDLHVKWSPDFKQLLKIERQTEMGRR
jgi:hypothetical protein